MIELGCCFGFCEAVLTWCFVSVVVDLLHWVECSEFFTTRESAGTL